ncbi:hypothetical protein HQ571_03325 [Candidatus Kuenenbacteria bacterium]|nr:hypothetical protein [Candidatus Kuenenbacteria bacterium]
MYRNAGTDEIELAMTESGKTYSFNEDHDEKLPAQHWFQESDEGMILFIVFYTQACRWSRCLGCNLPSLCSKFHVAYDSIMDQIDVIFSNPEVLKYRDRISKLIISNNGSILDEDTFSSTALMYLMSKLNRNFVKLSSISIETRPEYIDYSELDFLSRALKEGLTPTFMELAVGFEAFDDEIRNTHLKKGLDLGVLEKSVKQMAKFGFRLKCYLMLKPVPGISREAAVKDVQSALLYLDRLSHAYGIPINAHINPTYVARGTALEEAFAAGHYHPPTLHDTVRVALAAKGTRVSVFIGLYDEGLAVPNGSFIRPGPGDQHMIEEMEKFNRIQNFRVLENLL